MGPGRERGRGRGRAAATATDSEDEAAAEQPLGRLEAAEESSDSSDDGGSEAGAGGKGEGRRRPQLGQRVPGARSGGKQLPHGSVPSGVPAPASLPRLPGWAAGFGWSWVRGP